MDIFERKVRNLNGDLVPLGNLTVGELRAIAKQRREELIADDTEWSRALLRLLDTKESDG
jgi:hypothetical protein